MALNVAVNSKANAMITLLISTNFMEIKSSVFKGYKEESLFQTTLSGKFISLVLELCCCHASSLA
jgi:hypothetical protein